MLVQVKLLKSNFLLVTSLFTTHVLFFVFLFLVYYIIALTNYQTEMLYFKVCPTNVSHLQWSWSKLSMDSRANQVAPSRHYMVNVYRQRIGILPKISSASNWFYVLLIGALAKRWCATISTVIYIFRQAFRRSCGHWLSNLCTSYNRGIIIAFLEPTQKDVSKPQDIKTANFCE